MKTLRKYFLTHFKEVDWKSLTHTQATIKQTNALEFKKNLKEKQVYFVQIIDFAAI